MQSFRYNGTQFRNKLEIWELNIKIGSCCVILSFQIGGDSARRKGMTTYAKFRFLDPSDVYAILHAWIRAFYFLWKIFYHLNTRESFENGIPTMRGQFKGDKINEDVEKSRKALINKAKEEPINMLVDSPDPHGQ